MKNKLLLAFTPTLWIVLTIIFSNLNVTAQIQYGGTPPSFSHDLSSKSLETETFELTPAMKEKSGVYKSKKSKPGESMHAGFSLPSNINPLNSGHWDNLSDTLQVWRLRIQSPGALALGLVFDKFELAPGSRMFVYDENMETILGAFDHRNNNPNNIFTTHVIPGNTIIIEYAEKTGKDITPGKLKNTKLNISDIIHISNGSGFIPGYEKDLGDAEPCNVNINCPEGDAWQAQKRSIARMLMKVNDEYSWCTGALINNTANDAEPYFLSASHCGVNASSNDKIYWHFYFNFERPGCSDKGTPAYNMLHGSTPKSIGHLDEGSDFRLLLLRKPPPPAWKPYYSGWDRRNRASGSGVGIHHPAGDAKKISTYIQTTRSATTSIDESTMAENSSWRVTWDKTETDHGVTEGGSSGSPLFNSEGLIIGTLTGGSSDCENPYAPDYYGKFSYHWESNDPDDELKQLKPFLDPANTGVETLKGFDPYKAQYPPPGFLTVKNNQEEGVKIKWYRPGSTPNRESWHRNLGDFTHITWQGRERAVLFDDGNYSFSFPVTLEKLSHSFYEDEGHPWPNSRFKFKIYDADGHSLLYESPELTAAHLEEIEHTIDTPLVLDNTFYVSVRTSHSSGHPSSLMGMVNYGSGNSFAGSADNWSYYYDIASAEQFDLATNIYIRNNDNGKHYQSPERVKSARNINSFDKDEKTKSFINDINHEKIALSSGNNPGFYRIYRDNELLTEKPADETYSYIDNEIDYGFYKYNVSAVYDDEVESGLSNSVYFYFSNECNEQITDFPVIENFNTGELNNCWEIIQQSENSWQFSQEHSMDNNTIEPVDGNYFMHVDWSDSDNQDEWLITPKINLSEIDIPALRFWFNGSYTWSIAEEKCNLNVYASIDDGAFHKIWDQSEHPAFNSSQANYNWLQTLINLKDFRNQDNVRIAFQYKGHDGAIFAIDNIEIIDATQIRYSVALNVDPEFSQDQQKFAGTASGGGRYIKGEPVTIQADANIEFEFQEWVNNTKNETFSLEQQHTFIMPGNDVDLTANFESIVSVEETTLPSMHVEGYPNPARNEYNILFSNAANNITIRVFDLNGKLTRNIYQSSVTAGSKINIKLDDIAKGVYVINITTNEYQETLKVNIVD